MFLTRFNTIYNYMYINSAYIILVKMCTASTWLYIFMNVESYFNQFTIDQEKWLHWSLWSACTFLYNRYMMIVFKFLFLVHVCVTDSQFIQLNTLSTEIVGDAVVCWVLLFTVVCRVVSSWLCTMYISCMFLGQSDSSI